MERRKFIKLSAAASAIGITPFELQATLKSFMPFANCPDISNRKLILINLQGANDGLNTVIPINQYDIYSTLRPNIKVPNSGANSYITLDATLPDNQQIGLNPALSGLKNIYDKGWLRILQSVGYPSQNKSHFKSTDIYLTGNDGNSNLNGEATGWIGRFMELYYAHLTFETFPLAVQIGSTKTSLGFEAEQANGLALNINGQDPAGYYSIINGLGGTPPAETPNSDYGKELDYIINTDKLSNTYASSISSAFAKGKNNSTYPNTSISNQLKTVARLISGDLKSKVYMVQIGSFDTHNVQVQSGTNQILGPHYNLLTQLSQGIEAFLNDLNSQNLGTDVVGLTFSEFGRKAAENGNLGTDHGEIAPMFVFGEAVAGGVSGTNPELNEATSRNNWQIQTVQHDYRQTFTTLLQDYLGADDTIIDATFFNHTANNSFANLKLDTLLKDQYKVTNACMTLQYNAETPTETKHWFLYPNPARDIVNITGIDNDYIITYKIYNATGALITSKTDYIVQGKLSLNVSYLTNGLYLVEIISNNRKETHKLLKI